jgi:hypothetical protein
MSIAFYATLECPETVETVRGETHALLVAYAAFRDEGSLIGRNGRCCATHGGPDRVFVGEWAAVRGWEWGLVRRVGAGEGFM